MTYAVQLVVLNSGATIPEPLNRVTIKTGASNALDPADPSEATLSFATQPSLVYKEPDGSDGIQLLPASWWIGQRIQINCKRDDQANYTKAFEGIVDRATYTNQGPSEDSPLVEIHASGYLAALARYPVYQTFDAENETQRLLKLYSAMGTLWYQIPSDVTWADVAGGVLDTSWENVDANLFRPAINSSNTSPFDLEAVTYEGDSVMDILQDMAVGLSAMLDDQQGAIVYRNFNGLTGGTYFSRTVATTAYEPELIGQAGIENIYNSVTYQNSTQTASDSDLASWNDFGMRPVTVPTIMANYSDMRQMAQRKLVYLSNSSSNYLSELTVDYDAIATPIWAAGVRRWIFYDLPWTQKYGPQANYILKGMRLDITYEHAEATWILASSDQWDSLTAWKYIGSMAWNAYPATTKWNEVA